MSPLSIGMKTKVVPSFYIAINLFGRFQYVVYLLHALVKCPVSAFRHLATPVHIISDNVVVSGNINSIQTFLLWHPLYRNYHFIFKQGKQCFQRWNRYVSFKVVRWSSSSPWDLRHAEQLLFLQGRPKIMYHFDKKSSSFAGWYYNPTTHCQSGKFFLVHPVCPCSNLTVYVPLFHVYSTACWHLIWQ